MNHTPTDIAALSERYAELLLRESRTAATPMEKIRTKIEILQIDMQMHWSAMDFYL